MQILYVIFDEEGKITTYFGGPQDPDAHPGIVEISSSDPRYLEYYNSLPFWDQMGMPLPTND